MLTTGDLFAPWGSPNLGPTFGTLLDNVGPEQLEAADPKRQPVRAAAS
jgi:hypothetical protein